MHSTSHQQNLQHMLRRIDNMDSVAERKKNRFDTSVYPALLLRRREEMPPADLLDYHLALAAARAARGTGRPATARAAERTTARSTASRHARAEAIADERLRARAQREVREVTLRTERAVGARPATASAAVRSMSAPRQSPSSAGPRGARASVRTRRTAGERGERTEYDDYARRLTDAIIAERMYHADELRAFLRSALEDPRYAHLEQTELRARTEEVAAEFFIKLD